MKGYTRILKDITGYLLRLGSREQHLNWRHIQEKISKQLEDILIYPVISIVSWIVSIIDIHVAIWYSFPKYILEYPLLSTFYIQKSYPQRYPIRIFWLYPLYPIEIQDTYPYSISFVLSRPVILQYSVVSLLCILATSPFAYPTVTMISWNIHMRYPIESAICSGSPRQTTAAEQNKVATRARYQGVAKMSWDPASNVHLPQTCHWESNP